MKTLLKTSYPCLIKSDKDTCELEENDTLEIENEQFLFVYPQNGNIPFYIDVKSDIENRFVSIIKHKDKKIFLLEKSNMVSVEKKYNLSFSGKTCEVLISNNSICFKTDLQNTKIKIEHTNKNYEVFKHNNFACLKFLNDFYAYSIKKNKLFHFSANEITFKNGELNLTKKTNDSNNREKISKFKLEDEIVLLDESFVSSQTKSNSDLLPYKAMESIKAKDFGFVYDFLSIKLKNQIKKNQLIDFFGNITSFLPINETEFITISKNNKNYIKFDIVDNKIYDISIDKL